MSWETGESWEQAGARGASWSKLGGWRELEQAGESWEQAGVSWETGESWE